MKKNLLLCLAIGLAALATSCKPEQPTEEPPVAEEAKIESIAVTPSSGLSFGATVTLTATLTDATALSQYFVTITVGGTSVYEDVQMLTGASFTVNKAIVLPLVKNAAAGAGELTLTVKNSGGKTTTEKVALGNVAVPTFSELYLVTNSNATYTMVKEGDIFSVSELFPANASAKIYANADKSGLYWGMGASEIETMAAGNIPVSGETEANVTVTFNPVTFEFTTDEMQWEAIDEPMYIIGAISGHWADGDVRTEMESFKMQAYAMGDERYWLWTPPSLEGDDPNSGAPGFDMWGSVVPGAFGFKVAGEESYIFYDGTTIIESTSEVLDDNPFLMSMGGWFEFRLFFDGEKYTKVTISGDNRTLEYNLDNIVINGAVAGETGPSFGGVDLTKKEGTYFVYEGLVDLTNNASISAGNGLDLASVANVDPDLFTGGGNSSWTVIGPTGTYLVRIDPFAGDIYTCHTAGYPDALYMDGWGWAKYGSGASLNWQPDCRLTLFPVAPGASIYSGTFYNFGWGNDCSIFVEYYLTNEASVLPSSYMDITSPEGNGFYLPNGGDAYAGTIRIIVDLKGGLTKAEDGSWAPTNAADVIHVDCVLL